MKKIGLIGGLSYQSTLHYYQGINDGVNARLGGLASAEILLHSVNFAEYKKWMDAGDWEAIAEHIGDIALSLARSGADCIAIASNTMHKVANEVEDRLCCRAGAAMQARTYEYATPPVFIHIGDAVAKKCLAAGIKKVGLLGTETTMAENFIKDRLKENGIEEVLVPCTIDAKFEIDRIIFQELCKGEVKMASKRYLTDEVVRMAQDGVEGIILGGTELQMLLIPDSLWNEIDGIKVPLFDTTQAHIDALVDFCVSDEQ